ncbi:MAG: AAA family ATPase, partial [Nocardioides sp.]
MALRGFVLVGGWPGSGKSTLSRVLATEVGLPWLSKDEIKEALFASLGQPASVGESQRLGRAAADVLLRVARDCPGAVLDSTWYPRVEPMVRELPGPCVEVRCVVPVEVARARYATRLAAREPGHLDDLRDECELWGAPVAPVGVGPLVEVDTT